MRLKVLLPTQVLLDEAVSKVIAEAENGSLCLLPRHVDFVTALVPGILSYWTPAGEQFLAVDEGTLVKVGGQVLVSTHHAVMHRSLADLKSAVAEEFLALDKYEQQTRAVLARLEAAALHHFLAQEGRRHG